MSVDSPRYRLVFEKLMRADMLETILQLLSTEFKFSEKKTHMIISSPPRVLWDICSETDAKNARSFFHQLGCSVYEEPVTEHKGCPFPLAVTLEKSVTGILEAAKQSGEDISVILVQCELDRQGAPLPSMLGPFAADIHQQIEQQHFVAGIDDHNLLILARSTGRMGVHPFIDDINKAFKARLGDDEPLRIGFALFPEESDNLYNALRRAEFRCEAENRAELVFGRPKRPGGLSNRGSLPELNIQKVQTHAENETEGQREEILKKLSRHENLPTLPSIAMQVFNVISNPDKSASEVTEIIQNDPAFTAKMLKVVNSAYYGFPQEIASVQRAVVILGANEMVNLVCSLAAAKVFSERHVEGFCDLRQLWLHSVCTAGTADMLSKRADSEHRELLFTAGLLHDFGKLFLIEQFQGPYENVHKLSEKEEIPLYDAEERILGITHAEIGRELAILWNLPLPLIETIGHHHSVSASDLNLRLAATVALADALSNTVIDEKDDGDLKHFNEIPDRDMPIILELFGCSEPRELAENFLAGTRGVTEKAKQMAIT